MSFHGNILNIFLNYMIKSLKDIFESIPMFVIVFFFPFAVNITIFSVVSQAICYVKLRDFYIFKIFGVYLISRFFYIDIIQQYLISRIFQKKSRNLVRATINTFKVCIAENTGDECNIYLTNSGVGGEKKYY